MDAFEGVLRPVSNEDISFVLRRALSVRDHWGDRVWFAQFSYDVGKVRDPKCARQLPLLGQIVGGPTPFNNGKLPPLESGAVVTNSWEKATRWSSGLPDGS